MDEALRRQFEDMGPGAVRQWLESGQMHPAFQTHAREWLGQNAEQQRKAVGGTKKINIAQSTADANWEAARAAKKAAEIAIAALALAALAVVISIVALIVKKG